MQRCAAGPPARSWSQSCTKQARLRSNGRSSAIFARTVASCDLAMSRARRPSSVLSANLGRARNLALPKREGSACIEFNGRRAMSGWLPTSVKLFRIWLLVVLAVLLPIRGAMAAGMVCPPVGGMPVPQASQAQADHDHGAHAPEQAEQAHPDEETVGHAHESGPDRCNMCSASCSTLLMPSASSGLKAPVDLTSAGFPDLNAPAPTFQSDGQDRPPRTI